MAYNFSKVSGVVRVINTTSDTVQKIYFTYSGSASPNAGNDGVVVKINGDIFEEKLTSLQVNGQAPSTLSEALTLLQGLFLDANSSSGGTGSYLVYTALLTQSGTNAPIPTILENTIGDIVWTRQGPGFYLPTLTGAFTLNKTLVLFTPSVIFQAGVYTRYLSWEPNDEGGIDNIFIRCTDSVLGAADIDAQFISIEIRVYP